MKIPYISYSLSFMIFGFIISVKLILAHFLPFEVFSHHSIWQKNLSYIQHFIIFSKRNFGFLKIACTWGFEVWFGPVQASWHLNHYLGIKICSYKLIFAHR